MFEHQFNSLHPLHRLLDDYAKTVDKAFGFTPLEDRLCVIKNFKHLQQIIVQFNPHDGWCAYNFTNLVYTTLNTIEFRQHQGSLDPEAITHWAELACSLVRISYSNSDAVFRGLVEAHIGDSKYSIINLLLDLGLPRLARYYTQQGINIHESQPELSDECDW